MISKAEAQRICHDQKLRNGAVLPGWRVREIRKMKPTTLQRKLAAQKAYDKVQEQIHGGS